jgi:hypothetical protein
MKSIKNIKDPIGYQTRDLPSCSAVSQTNALQRTPRWAVSVGTVAFLTKAVWGFIL